MDKRHIRHVMRSEWRKTRKTPAQLLMMLIVPVVSVLFMMWCMCYVHVMVDKYHATVYLPDEETATEIGSYLGEYYPSFKFTDGTREDAEDLVHEGKIDCALVVSKNEVRILYDSSVLTSSLALKDANDCANDLVYLLEGEEMLQGAYDLYPESKPIDVSTDEQKLSKFFDQMAGLIGMILFLMMASNAMTLSAKSITGEKERQTFDSLVLCPAPLRKILLGKELVMMTEIFLSGLAGILAAIAGMAVWYPYEFKMIGNAAGKDPAWCLVILILIVSVTLVISGIFSVIGSAFSQTKKASLFSSAGMVVVSVAAILPNFIDNEIVRFIPVANWTPVIKQLGKNKVDYPPLFAALAVSALLAVMCMILSSGLWERTSE